MERRCPTIRLEHAPWSLVAAAVLHSGEDRLALLPLTSSALGDRAGDILGLRRPACVQAIASRAEMRDLQKSANDHDVLEEMDHLISVGKVMVKEDRRCERKYSKS